MPRKATTSKDAMLNTLNRQQSVIESLTQETEAVAQNAPKKRGRKPKEQDIQRCTFIVSPPETWENFKLYAEILGENESGQQTTATDLLLGFIRKTVEENADAISIYKESKAKARLKAIAALPDKQSDQ